ncbi:iron chelate uptake ABC transporter family permease subunit [Formosa sediminum]|uniref:Iron chelate uptake ABC transporter family permease subunit n=1 Tax=Formosa sediminum TaxID=2594004 RepID=A0A516GSH7_9FLAO|nr:iron chelate uptake ABC transporter family permease subunit [Formosa sediminum]QDO94458.1 iron chelate uptake ABC transporter family permease subunit [Formosa sediminum]
MRLFLLLIALFVLSVLSLFVGIKSISIVDILHWTSEDWMILTLSRLPRTLAVLLTGIGISICGLIMQQMTQNKFVSPTTAGTLEAAKLGILGAIVCIPQYGALYKLIFAFLVTFIASVIFLKIADRIRHKSIIFIPVLGLLFGGVIKSITTFFAFQFNIVQDTETWLIGDFSGVLQGNYEVIFICLPIVIITYLYANKFTVVGMGESFSKNLGLDYRGVLLIGLLCISLTVSAIAVTIGTIPFLGLIIPNVVSLLYGDNLRKTLPYTAVIGALFVLVCDLLGRLIIYPFEVPIGMMVGLIGGLVFLILLIRKR